MRLLVDSSVPLSQNSLGGAKIAVLRSAESKEYMAPLVLAANARTTRRKVNKNELALRPVHF